MTNKDVARGRHEFVLLGAKSMRILIVLCALIIEVSIGRDFGQAAAPQAPPAQQPNPAQAAPAAAPEPFERQIRKTVSFITMSCLEGNMPTGIRGTGFFVSMTDSRLPGREFKYLVTNRHMAKCWDRERHERRVQSIVARLNLKNGTVTELRMIGNFQWILPSDESVDLAIFPLAPDPEVYDYLAVPDSMLATEDVIKKESVSEGLKIVFSGFFYQFPGMQRIQPIIREGVLAMMPDEDLFTTTGKMGRVYLGEVHSFHGNSGSPVFVDVGGFRGGSLKLGVNYFLLGIVSGGYIEDAESNLTLESTITDQPGNSGIAMIVPASALRSLLDDPRTVAIRETEIAKWTQQKK